MSLTIYLLRHGQTEHSRDNLFCGWIDPELTASGRQMAEAFAATYSDFAWNEIYTSPMKRTQGTAAPLCEKVGLKTIPREEIKEINYGLWEGKQLEEIKKQYPEEFKLWSADPALHRPPQGELAGEILHRAMSLIEEVKGKFSNHSTPCNVLFVSHKATIRILLCGLLGIDLSLYRYRLGMPVSGLTAVEFGEHGPLVKMIADRSHLSKELRALPST